MQDSGVELRAARSLGDEVQYTAWIVNCRGKHDTQFALELCELGMCASSSPEAWKKFLALVGKDRRYWNKLGYIAEQVAVKVEFVSEKK